MKFGFRVPNLKKSIKSRTTGRINRNIKKAVNPLYGKKGMGIVNDPKKSLYNAIYSKTTVGVYDFVKDNQNDGMYDFKSKAIIDSKNYNQNIAVILHYCEYGGKPIGISNDDYPRWFLYKFDIGDPIAYHKEAINKGFLSESEPNIALERLKVEELKEILVSNGFSKDGKKKELIDRIVEKVDVSKLNIRKVYVPSKKGWKHLTKYKRLFE